MVVFLEQPIGGCLPWCCNLLGSIKLVMFTSWFHGLSYWSCRAWWLGLGMVCYVCVGLGFVCGNIGVAPRWFVWALDGMCVWGAFVVVSRQLYKGFKVRCWDWLWLFDIVSNLVLSEVHLVYFGVCVCCLVGNDICGCCIVGMWVVWRFIWGHALFVCGWCMGFCVISLSVFGILIYVGGK